MKRPLVHEADVLARPAGSTWVLPRRALVTPAARDAAFRRRVRLVSADDADDESAAASSSAATWPTLPDGDYVVQVRDGQVTVRPIGPVRDA